ncbi:MAG: BatA domain-containing protein [Flavobacteriales bacterium]|nr:BatA domain-containing protein [Flavobacteriales bacterium]HRO39636.1 BatA domain-containing protein [Flavobacteriales bacterium]HRP82053.1 BatA domain-containing protein [Flavobacteriales bacterium]
MAFLYPNFLWALTALAIPVIIHLFQLRRFKRIEFPNVQFLQEVTQQTRSRKKVRHWLVLLARLLALASIVLAFAQPYFRSKNGAVVAGQRAVSLYLDDSWSMDGQNGAGRLLDQARTDAQDVVMAYKPTDRFQVLTNRFEGRQQMLLGRDEALAAAGQVEVGPYSRPLSQVMERQREALARSEAPVKKAFLFTDLQRAVTDVEQWSNDSAVQTVIVPLEAASADNLAIDSVWFGNPVRRMGQVEQLNVRVRNYGSLALHNVPLKLGIDGRQRAMATFGIGPGAQVDTVLNFTNDSPGFHTGTVEIDDRPITFDNVMHIAYRTTGKLHVLLLGGGDPASDKDIEAVFRGDSAYAFSTQPYRQVDLASLASQDLVVLNGLPDLSSGLAGAVREFAEGGGSVAIFPADRVDEPSYRGALSQFSAGMGVRDTAAMRVERIDLRAPFYRDVFNSMPANVDLPLVRTRYAITPGPAAEVLLRLQSGSAFLSAVPIGKGRAYLCAAPLGAAGGNFSGHALFVTSLLRMAELARPAGALYHIIGGEAVVTLEGVDLPGEAPPQLKGAGGMALIPEVRRTLGGISIVLHDEDIAPGTYALTAGSDTAALLALNLPRKEGDLGAYSPEQLKEELAKHGITSITLLDKTGNELAADLKSLDQGTKLWKWFIAAALLFLMLEVLLIRTSR